MRVAFGIAGYVLRFPVAFSSRHIACEVRRRARLLRKRSACFGCFRFSAHCVQGADRVRYRRIRSALPGSLFVPAHRVRGPKTRPPSPEAFGAFRMFFAPRRIACEMRIAFGFAGDAALRPAVSREVRYRPSSDVGRSAPPHCGGVHPPEIRAGPAAGADPRLPLPAAARKNPSCAGRFSARHASNPVRHGARPHR